jgi:phytoene synthase
VNKDLRQGRIYLPREDMERFHYSEAELLAAASPSKGGLTTASLSGGGQDRQYNARFVELMEFEAGRAEQFFARAAELLPPEDRQSMVAAEIMASIYHAILRRMKADRFRVFEKDYGLTKLAKARHIATQLLRSCIRIPD